MTGQIKNIVNDRFFGFIYANGKEYFFHKTDFIGEWHDLENLWKLGKPIEVEFEISERNQKGPRAKDVKLV